MPASPPLTHALRWGADPLPQGKPRCAPTAKSRSTGLPRAAGALKGEWRGSEGGSRTLGWGARGAAPLPCQLGRVLVNRSSAAPESEAAALFISRQPGSPPPPLSAHSSCLCRQLVRLPSACPAPGAETVLGREPRAPARDRVTPAHECMGPDRTRMLDSRFLHRQYAPLGRRDPGVPVTLHPAAVTTMWGFVACRVPVQGQVAVVPPGPPGWSHRTQAPADSHPQHLQPPEQGRNWGFVELLISGRPAASASTAPQVLVWVLLQ